MSRQGSGLRAFFNWITSCQTREIKVDR